MTLRAYCLSQAAELGGGRGGGRLQENLERCSYVGSDPVGRAGRRTGR